MFSAYMFHAVNMIVAIVLVPLLLHHLSPSEYALWLIFLAFGGLTIHLQNAIQNSSVKEIARGLHLGEEPVESLQRMRSAYAGLVVFVMFPFLIVGLIYLHINNYGNYFIEWCIFALTYAVIYWFAPNYSVLLGTDRVSTSNRINTLTRFLYLVFAAGLLAQGFSVLAVCLSFALSTLVSAAFSTYATRNDTYPQWKWSLSLNLKPYAIFAVCAYALYNGSFLVAAAKFPRDVIASYGLGLQIGLLLVTLSLAPLQVWLARLVRAISSGDEKKELLRNLVVINLIFLSGAIFLLIFGNELLLLVGSRIALPQHLELILGAFAVELNIAVLVNYLMARGDYGFVRIYVPISICALLLGIMTVIVSGNLYAFIVVPLCIQILFCLPRMFLFTFTRTSADYVPESKIS